MRSGTSIFTSWVWKMAWRDSRASRTKLLSAMASGLFGIAALVAITSFRENLEDAIQFQAKTLLGADLVIKSRQPFSEKAEELISSIGGEQSHQISFASMVYFPRNKGIRLARIRALRGTFPYYGVLETVPVAAAQDFTSGRNALVDDSLMLQFDARVGDTVKIGAVSFRIVGRLKKIPGEAPAASLIRPRIFIPMAYLGQTRLIQAGSVARYRVFFKSEHDFDTEKLLERIESHVTEFHLEVDTVKKRKARIGWAMENLSRFLNLVGFMALLLGGIGVASGIQVYTRQKINTVAILRCLGAESRQTFMVYLIQSASMGLVGSFIGALLGMGIQKLLPLVLTDFLPMRVTVSFSFSTLLLAIGIGLGTAILFALLPLVSLRRISPLLSLRSSFEGVAPESRDLLRWLIYLLIAAVISSFAVAHTAHWSQGLAFAGGILGVFALLAVTARLIRALVKSSCPDSWPYTWRQGLANLHRPGNQTLALMVSVGLGTFLILILYLSQKMLLEQVSLTSKAHEPNMVLFDVQPDQRVALSDLLTSLGLRLYQEVPVVTMRLATVNGKPTETIRADPKSKIPKWALRREYRSTYRDHLIDTEMITAGRWQGNAVRRSELITSETVPVSLEKGLAERLEVTLGDKLVFDIQGVPVTTVVSSIRKVDWQRVQPNFFVVFPTGVLEKAPQFYVLVTRVPTAKISATLQRMVVEKFPNVSTIDLTLIMNTVDAILSKVSFVIRFIASFSILTGLLVLAGTVLTSRSQRLKESSLLRTLGAPRKKIVKIIAIEYLFLGGCAAASGIILALMAIWVLAYYYFATIFVPPLLMPVMALILVTGVTILAGILGSQGIYNRPAREVLRTES
ncbi:MAG: ABC transporter permease [Candidatus Binatia bacterium]